MRKLILIFASLVFMVSFGQYKSIDEAPSAGASLWLVTEFAKHERDARAGTGAKQQPNLAGFQNL